jgi:hypothetical protein
MAEGIGPTVVTIACSVAKPEAVAEIDVVPGLNVVLKFAEANVVPLKIMIDESTVPMFMRDDERLIVVSCNALAGCPDESSNCTKIQL